MNADREVVAPFGWYRAEDYARLREISADADANLAPTFKQWRKHAQRLFDGLRAQGLGVVKVMIDPEKMHAWAAGRRIDSRLRAQYAIVAYEELRARMH